MSVRSAGTTACSGDKVYVLFEDAPGDVPLLSVSVSGLTGGSSPALNQYTSADNGAVDGIHLLWGTFALSYDGERTTPIYFDASAAEVEAALEDLPSIGDVSVVKDSVGLREGLPGKLVAFAVWSVTFDGRCISTCAERSTVKPLEDCSTSARALEHVPRQRRRPADARRRREQPHVRGLGDAPPGAADRDGARDAQGLVGQRAPTAPT